MPYNKQFDAYIAKSPDWAKPILAVQMADPARRPTRSYPDAEEKPRKGVA